jgi:cysteine desulfurase
MTTKIYLDNNATTALDPQVAACIMEDLNSPPSNPSSMHFFGRDAKLKLLKARESIARFFSVKPQEVIFTSSGTESMNLLLRGLIDPTLSPHVITSNIEHSCVQKTLLDLSEKGCKVSFLPAGLKGAVSLEELRQAITPETKFLVFSAASSETGVKIDLKGFADLALECNIPLLIDGVAQLGKEPFTFHPGIVGAGFSAHKFHGPKGVGFIVMKAKAISRLKPILTGGGQEAGLRSGTENLTGILALAEAINQIQNKMPIAMDQMRSLRDRFEKEIIANLPFVQVNGQNERLCNVSNLCFQGVDAETLLIQLDINGVAASQGSACSSGALEPSRVLMAMGLSKSLAGSSLRFSLSRFTTEEEIDTTVEIISTLVPKLR